jgi:phospholipid N-methyltransferase
MSTEHTAVHRPDWLLFLQRWLRHPRIVGAIAPSSGALARAMLAAAAPIAAPVLELGAGTGVFTRALIDSGVPLSQLRVVERLPEFADALRRRLPGLSVLECDAAELAAHLQPSSFGSVVSGLPLRAMPETQIEAILRAAFACARPEARFVQFSYGLRCPVSAAVRQRLGLSAKRVRWVGWNLPPASVWRFERK